MKCKQLGGACDLEFHAETFDQIAEMSKNHGMEMFQKSEPDHMKAMGHMKDLMNDPKAMQDWMQQKREEFEALPEDK